jgi:phosphate:Na+ symporter
MLTLAGTFLGGLGLFLLGMWLMTEGLKQAAGQALERILRAWTSTRLRGLASGVLVTTLVQSSSAVTVAVIGFANAGLLSFGQTMWVIFGSNVGTTMTGWLVALIGFNLKIEAFALPALGLGMLLRLTGEGTRRSALGVTLAGFGALFLGIDVLREAFGGIGERIALDTWVDAGPLGWVIYVAIGVLLTTLMQSSSAALAVTLTATAGGVLPLPAAAALAIGVNVGTTVKALLASIGATPNARRAAAAHVAFNVLTAAVALALLVPLLALIQWVSRGLGLDASAPTLLAAFHTTFNLLGVLLMWPLSPYLERFLQRRFRSAEEDDARPQHLDPNVLAVPSLALEALLLEVRRLGTIAVRIAESALHGGATEAQRRDRNAVRGLGQAIGAFVVRVNRAGMERASAERLPRILSVVRHYERLVDMAAATRATPRPAALADGLASYLDRCAALIARTDPAHPLPPLDELQQQLFDVQQDYVEVRQALLASGAHGALEVAAMDAALEQARGARIGAEEAVKAARGLLALAAGNTQPPSDDDADDTASAAASA